MTLIFFTCSLFRKFWGEVEKWKRHFVISSLGGWLLHEPGSIMLFTSQQDCSRRNVVIRCTCCSCCFPHLAGCIETTQTTLSLHFPDEPNVMQIDSLKTSCFNLAKRNSRIGNRKMRHPIRFWWVHANVRMRLRKMEWLCLVVCYTLLLPPDEPHFSLFHAIVFWLFALGFLFNMRFCEKEPLESWWNLDFDVALS